MRKSEREERWRFMQVESALRHAGVPIGAVLDGPGRKALAAATAARHPALFLDYDGTLTAIAPRPELARLDPAMRERLRRLAARGPVAVVSGRDLDNVRDLVGLAELTYVGCHGLDMALPDGRLAVGEEQLPALDRAEQELRRAVAAWPGARIERKRLTLALHTRGAAPAIKQQATDGITDIAGGLRGLRLSGGKEVVELRPDVDWDKGRAVLALLERPAFAGRLPVYVGDDLTDEDAFKALAGRGLGILVGEHGVATAASVRVANVEEVGCFLDELLAAPAT
jgi:trehalose 6-phosphate phosphatase